MKIVDMMEKVFQMRTFNDRINVINKSFPIFWKLQRRLRSHKIRSTFYTEKTLRKLLRKPKDRVATEDKNNITYELDCSNCQAVYFGESKRSLKLRSDEHKRSVRKVLRTYIVTNFLFIKISFSVYTL